METFVKGDVVVIPFPFSDLSSTKKRPALILSALEGQDMILCQITSRDVGPNKYSINLDNTDFKEGSLNIPSYIKPSKLFTADKSLILYKIGELKQNKLLEVIDRLCKLLKGS